jgi:hypothetical protein
VIFFLTSCGKGVFRSTEEVCGKKRIAETITGMRERERESGESAYQTELSLLRLQAICGVSAKIAWFKKENYGGNCMLVELRYNVGILVLNSTSFVLNT